MPAAGLSLIYAVFANEAEAERITRRVVEARLAACANIFSPHKSIYHWQGKIEEGAEVAVIFKTRADLFEALKGEIVKNHGYECPCVVALPIEKGHKAFLEWIGAETKVL